ncbi:MAG TPA: S-layer homology domain-containing protein [Candidatus Ventrousia excrementavium]|uniref:S-layer homology domain-containing protein n=1 Tax=Candidatus Ventrousia excrementavium TaxID=2840961 RepID=A0A9D1IUK4_9CLOT|nr:S-layer homology domain-containing protein [Candidatus Ventrousia excrementavium]
MRKIKRLLIALMAAVMLVGIIPAAYAADTGALNGESGSWSQFDKGVYDVVVSSSTFKGTFEWPDSPSKVCVTASATNPSYTIAKFNGITIPAGMIVDIYKYSGSADTYTLLGHFDTTDGKSITIGKDTSTAGNSGSNSTSKPSNSGTIEEDWGNVRKTYHPGQTAKPYSNSYTDVASNAWYYDAVMTMTEGGLLAGYGNGKFGPDDALTRTQLAIISGRLIGFSRDYDYWTSGKYATDLFTVNADRAYTAIYLMNRTETIGGTTSLTEYETALAKDAGGLCYNIASNGKLTLGSMWTAVYDNWRAGLAAGKQINYRTSIDEFPDADAIHKWIEENYAIVNQCLDLQYTSKERLVDFCERMILRAYNLGMIGGVDDKGTFDPYGNLTRAQASQMLFNMGWTYEEVVRYN